MEEVLGRPKFTVNEAILDELKPLVPPLTLMEVKPLQDFILDNCLSTVPFMSSIPVLTIEIIPLIHEDCDVSPVISPE